jgi:hypothetical protein
VRTSNPIGSFIIFSSFSTQTLVCPRLLRNLSQPEQLARLKAQIECEQPTSDLYNFFGKIEIFPSEANVWNESLVSDRISIQSVRTSQHAYSFDGIALQNISTRNGDITLQQYCVDNDVTLRRASVLDGNVCTNHNRDSASCRSSIYRSAYSQCVNAIRLEPVAMDLPSTGEAAPAQITTQEGCGETQSVECRVDAVLNKNNVNSDEPGLEDQVLNGTSNFGGVNFVGREVDKNTSSQAYGSNVNSVLSSVYVRTSVLSKQGSVKEARLSAEQLDSLVQDTNTSPLGTENLLLRGARLKNTEFVIGKCYLLS